MIEIDSEVGLSHPADRVWRALTEPELIARWFTEVEPVAGGHLLLYTAGLPGFDAAVDAEVTERREPELLELRCDEAGRRTRLTFTITPTAEGCRLSVREALEHGTWPAEQRARREECYQQALTGRLPAILDWLAFQQVDLRRDELGDTARLPVTAAIDDAPARRGRRLVLIAVLAAAVLAVGLTVWAVLPREPQPVAGSDPTPLPEPTVGTGATHPPRGAVSARPRPTTTTASARSTRSVAKPSRTPTALPPPAPGVTARYTTVSTRIFGYTGEVVVDNRGDVPVADWTVVVTLSKGGTVAGARGADWRQDGQTVTFTGPPVPAGGSQTFTFDVRDPDPRAKAPEGCTVGDEPCAGATATP
ncbi:SRPBCC domain-containing protein [Micromonospora sp. 4G57]|uniref:SRPBCC domain-containing protein n=1 Tax=Micromonospora sicca TaxID=2202420 RepID=A0ABU5JBN0_9ACTN|nr:MULTISPECIES: SRPBCC domain-containing protein [unclassified Micromonospora]MDZ5441600.1 SRPBCC domain-containing protein [Micromonospora sp. 4G57]MDZ5489997.1 SRPBCC domain-containing protein [Micromonospora sp. 4G53]